MVEDAPSPTLARRRYSISMKMSRDPGEVFARVLKEPWILESMTMLFPDTKKNDRGVDIEKSIRIVLGTTIRSYIEIRAVEGLSGEYEFIVDSNDHDLAHKVADIIESMTKD